jgi:hypothetical protein
MVGVFMFLFLLMLIVRVIGLSLNFQRWANFILIPLLSLSVFIFILCKKSSKWILFAVGLYVLFNALASISNLLGRITIYSDFRLYSGLFLRTTISLGVFVRIYRKHFYYRFRQADKEEISA